MPLDSNPTSALVLTGGGARGSYQAGVLCYVREHFPHARFPIHVGVSAGAVNAAHLANHVGPRDEAAVALADLWREITPDDVFTSLSTWRFLRRALTDYQQSDDPVPLDAASVPRGLLDAAPLRRYLTRRLRADGDGRLAGVYENLRRGDLRALAIVTTSYTTGQTITWVEGKKIEGWERPMRRSVQAALTVDHILGSTALPMIFPAVRLHHRRLGPGWYGDGGIRLTAPFSPAIHLGADRILAISTRYRRSTVEANEAAIVGYPPPAQVVGLLMNAIFLDVLDQDAATLRRVNDLVAHLTDAQRRHLRPVRLLLLRPSVDLAKLASQYEVQLDGVLALATRGLGSRQTKSPDWLSMLLFDSAYTTRLVDIGYADARAQHDRLARFFDAAPVSSV
ncbi:MAG: patatin-like phospholipase family protein [Bacteroidota bacterium]